MPISLERARQHNTEWQANLPDRGYWPRFLFFTAHVTTAATILGAGELRSRRLVGNVGFDIAHPEAIAINEFAWDFVRLYFRPRTVFHMRTEGIKLLTDRHRLAAHMSVPVMFVFKLEDVVTRAGVCFSGRKMAHRDERPGNDEQFFNNIDFSRVYHESPIVDPQLRSEIHDARMAEVLVPERLPLLETLEAIVCRTAVDAQTLRHLVADGENPLLNLVRSSTRAAEMFFCQGAYVRDLSLSARQLTFQVKPSQDYRPGQLLRIAITQVDGRESMEVNTPLEGGPVVVTDFDPAYAGAYRIEIEDALAFEATPERIDNIIR